MHHCNTLEKYLYIVIQYNFTYLYTNPMETMGTNIEIIPCTIREQRKAKYHNILNTT